MNRFEKPVRRLACAAQGLILGLALGALPALAEEAAQGINAAQAPNPASAVEDVHAWTVVHTTRLQTDDKGQPVSIDKDAPVATDRNPPLLPTDGAKISASKISPYCSTSLSEDAAAGSTTLSVSNARSFFAPGASVSVTLEDGSPFKSMIAKISPSGQLVLSRPLPKAAKAKAVALPDDLVGLDLKMTDVALVCRLLRDYAATPDLPVKIFDSYGPAGDRAWRQQIRDACVDVAQPGDIGGCAVNAAIARPDGVNPEDTIIKPRDSVANDRFRDDQNDPPSWKGWKDWDRQDRTVIEFEWTPCTPYLVDEGWDRWRKKHLNIATTGTAQQSLGHDDRAEAKTGSLPYLDYKKRQLEDYKSQRVAASGRVGEVAAAKETQRVGSPNAKLDSNDPNRKPLPADAATLQNVCLSGATVRTGLRDRWANYVHIALREQPVSKDDPDCADCGMRFREDYEPGEVPHSRVTEISWKNSWLDRQQWLVLLRDHFLARLKTEGLDPNYQFSDAPVRLVYCGPEIRYGGVPAGRRYYWKQAGPGNAVECEDPGPSKDYASGSAKTGFKELTISFVPDATLILSRGPEFHDPWDRAQSRFIGQTVERLARYETAAPLVQNDDVPNAHTDNPPPMPADPSRPQRNQEAPRRDAVTPRTGDVLGGDPVERPESAAARRSE